MEVRCSVPLNVRPKFFDLKDRQSHVIGPEVGGKPGLLLELGHELVRLRKLFPDLRQKGGAPPAVLKNDAVDAGTKAAQGIGFAPELERLQRGQHGNLNAHGGQFVGPQGWKARVAKSGSAGVVSHVVVKGAMRFERAYAAAQLPVKGKGDEGGCRFIEPDRTWQGGPRRTEFGSNGSARQCGEEPPSGLMFSWQCEFFRKGHRCVTDDATFVAGRVAGISLVYQVRGRSRAVDVRGGVYGKPGSFLSSDPS